jgi:hypothetical protein
MAELYIREELCNQRVDQMVHAPISFPFEPYALQYMVIPDSILGDNK